ncbi:MAG: hypothetical protein ACI4VW_03550 [Acutalibacteraceae bacterium]
MKVLAERADKYLILTPVMIIVCLFVCYLEYCDWVLDKISLGRGFVAVEFTVFPLTFKCLKNFVMCILMPKNVIEYDDCGIYIYKRRNQEPMILRYGEIFSKTAENDQGYICVEIFYMFTEFAVTFSMGTLRIEVKDGFVRVPCIKNVRKVQTELNRLLIQYRKKQRLKYGNTYNI